MGVRLTRHTADSIGEAFAKRKTSNLKVRRLNEPSLHVQFLDEPFDWVSFQQVWVDGHAVVITDENFEQYRNERLTTKYMANVVGVLNQEHFVIEMPKTLADRVHKTYARRPDGTITNCQIELTKEGTGMDTTYDAFFSGSVAPNLQIDKFDLEEAVLDKIARDAEYAQSNGKADLDEAKDDDAGPRISASGKKIIRRSSN